MKSARPKTQWVMKISEALFQVCYGSTGSPRFLGNGISKAQARMEAARKYRNWKKDFDGYCKHINSSRA